MESPNLSYIKEISGGDAAFEESLLSVLRKEFPVEYAVFIQNFNKGDYNETSNNVHKIKHKISIFGLKKGLELASAFEKDLKKGEILLYEDFVKVLNKIRVYLEVK